MITRRQFIQRLSLTGGSILLGLNSRAKAAAPPSWQPAYARMEEGRFSQRIQEAYQLFEECHLCPRRCGVNRLKGEKGFCQASSELIVYSANPHFGEELPLVGQGGSGTIFFSNCNLRCVFCQNWPIAHEGWGRRIRDEELARMMLDLQRRGCHNINLVTPTHVMPNILNATRMAWKQGLHLPLCYNTGGYELAENIEMLDGIVDIYLPDLKFMDGQMSNKYVVRGADDYPFMAQKAIMTMHEQVGDLVCDSSGIARKGLMIRHLVMPNQVAGTREFVYWVAKNLSTDTYVNIMSQYRVEHLAFEYGEIARAITSQEFVEAVEWAQEAGLTNLDARSLSQLQIHRRRL